LPPPRLDHQRLTLNLRELAVHTQTSNWGAATATDQDLIVRVNSDSGTNYGVTQLNGNGTSAASSRSSNNTRIEIGSVPAANAAASTYGTILVDFMNYSNTTTNKTVLVRSNDAGVIVRALVNLWRSTSAITSINILSLAGNLASGTVATLYGIKAA
jgi:hypothetical protein